MGIFEDGIRTLDQMGVMDVILPFFLVFAIVFAVLQKTRPFGDASKNNIHAVLAIVLGFATIFPHVMTPGSRYDVVPIINNSLPQIGIILVAIVCLLMMLGLLMGQKINLGGPFAKWGTGIALIIVIYIFGTTAGWFNGRMPYWVNNSETVAIVVTILIFGLVINYIMKEEKVETDEEKNKKHADFFKNFFNGGQ